MAWQGTYASKHKAMLMDDMMDLCMIQATLNEPKTAAKMTKNKGLNTHTHMHMLKGQCLGTNEGLSSTLEKGYHGQLACIISLGNMQELLPN